jgi:hypothetical protein
MPSKSIEPRFSKSDYSADANQDRPAKFGE